MSPSRSPSHPTYTAPPRWRLIALTFVVLAAALFPIAPLVNDLQRRTRGIVFGPPPAIPHTDVAPYAVNADLVGLSDADLARAIRLLKEGGFAWARVRFPWYDIEKTRGRYDWAPYDRVVTALRQADIGIIALIVGTPPWYRPPGEEDNPVVPPTDMDALAQFAATLAARYADAIDYYQIWDQPNVTPFWGNERVDPAGYVAMLRTVAPAVRRADARAVILSAGLLPTTLHEPYHFSDVDYLDAMYRAGAKGTFDILGAKAYDLYDSSPWRRDYKDDPLGVARLVLLREVMERHGDAGTPIWVVGWGRHATPPNWQGRPSIWGTVSEEEQAEYVRQVFRRKRQEWPWLGLLTWDQFYPRVPLDDPLWGFALVRPNWEPRPVYRAFQDITRGSPLVGIGRYGPAAWVWRSPDPQLRHTVRAEGNRISLIATELVAVEASLDGEERSVLLDANKEHVLGNRLALQPHTLVLRFDPPGVTTLIVARNRPLGPYLLLGFLALVVVASLGRIATWLTWQPTEPVVYPALLLVLTAFYMVAPTLALSLITLALVAALILYRLDWGLVTVMAVVPFVAVPKRLGPWQFSLLETYILVCAVGWGARVLASTVVAAAEPETAPLVTRARLAWDALSQKVRPRGPLDTWLLVLLPLAVIAALTARHKDVAWREVRWVVIEPLLFYWMVRSRWRDHFQAQKEAIARVPGSWARRYKLLLTREDDVPRFAARLVNGFLWGAVLAVLAGVVVLIVRPEGAYAEGVWRLRGLYGSPNNLALVLGRGIALAGAIALLGGRSNVWGMKAWPRVLPGLDARRGYALVGGFLLVGMVATFSRGALLVGLPALILFLGWAYGPRGRRYALLAVAVLLVVLIPFFSTERFRTLVTGTGTFALRVELWRSALRMVRDHPWLGVGPDNFLYYFREAYLPRRDYPEPNLSHPHNIVLHFWLAFGILGVVWIAVMLGLIARAGWRLLQRLPVQSMSRALVWASLGMTVYGVAHGLVDQSFLLPDLMVLFVFGNAMLASIGERIETV